MTTEPIHPPVVWAKGRWKCLLCGQRGSGGSDGFHEHYMAHHWERE